MSSEKNTKQSRLKAALGALDVQLQTEIEQFRIKRQLQLPPAAEEHPSTQRPGQIPVQTSGNGLQDTVARADMGVTDPGESNLGVTDQTVTELKTDLNVAPLGAADLGTIEFRHSSPGLESNAIPIPIPTVIPTPTAIPVASPQDHQAPDNQDDKSLFGDDFDLLESLAESSPEDVLGTQALTTPTHSPVAPINLGDDEPTIVQPRSQPELSKATIPSIPPNQFGGGVGSTHSASVPLQQPLDAIPFTPSGPAVPQAEVNPDNPLPSAQDIQPHTTPTPPPATDYDLYTQDLEQDIATLSRPIERQNSSFSDDLDSSETLRRHAAEPFTPIYPPNTRNQSGLMGLLFSSWGLVGLASVIAIGSGIFYFVRPKAEPQLQAPVNLPASSSPVLAPGGPASPPLPGTSPTGAPNPDLSAREFVTVNPNSPNVSSLPPPSPGSTSSGSTSSPPVVGISPSPSPSPSPTTASSPPTVMPAGSSALYYVISEYNNDLQAFQRAQKLPTGAYLVQFQDGVKIQFGAYETRADAENLVNSLKQQGFVTSVREPRR